MRYRTWNAPTSLLTASALTLVVLLSTPAEVQGQIFNFNFVPTTSQNWNVDANWMEMSGAMVVPDATTFDVRANIGSGGTAVVQTPNPPAPGGVIITNGAVTINSSATLTTQVPPGMLLDGSIYLNSGAAQTATLNVLPGGTLAPVGPLLSAGNVANTIVMGGTAAGTATVSVPSASFNGTTRVYPNAAFTSTGTVTFGAAGFYRPEINGASAASLNIGQNAKLAGTLAANFTGPAPAVGATWSLMQADDVQGSFFVTSNLTLPANQRLMTRVAPIAGNRERLDLELREVLVLNVNRDTGVVRITQPGSTSIPLDTYTITSSQTRIVSGGWTSLADQGAFGGSWNETAPSTSSVSETRATGNGAAAGGANVSLGAIYNPLAGTFASTVTDVGFQYSDRDGRIVDGVVNYTGTTVNNLLLQVDPVTGRARLRNPSNTTMNIFGYVVSSTASLTPANWKSLDDQNVAGGDWVEALNLSSAQIAEFKTAVAPTTLAPHVAYDLGSLFNPAAAQNLTFEFLQVGQDDATFGAVVYETIRDADFDGDNDVDGNDFVRWQRGLGMTTGATPANGDANNDGAVNAADLAIWRTQFGLGSGALANATPSATQVPEPASVTLALAAALAGSTRMSKRRTAARSVRFLSATCRGVSGRREERK